MVGISHSFRVSRRRVRARSFPLSAERRAGVALLLLACATSTRPQWRNVANQREGRGRGERAGDDSNKSGEVILRLETYCGKRSDDAAFRCFISRRFPATGEERKRVEPSSSSGFIPPLLSTSAPFNSRLSESRGRGEMRVAQPAINNPLVSLPSPGNLFRDLTISPD